ncbi:general transcription factor II-I repeat domain-containing protein 2-like [Palaemon carinicauda]|uniref:general transcription factor II-I repeat domain-containing protein 2-like n=1 Tax=Palaemon carinicauda TaxID=392227 RepID=UPI0035B67304
MLKIAYELLNEIVLFVDMKGNSIPEMNDNKWKCDLSFLVGIIDHLSTLKVILQEKGQLVNDMFSLIKGFQTKLRLGESQIRNQNTAHFQTLNNYAISNEQCLKKGVRLTALQEESSMRFHVLRKHSIAIELLENSTEDMQIDIIELQFKNELRSSFGGSSIYLFYEQHLSNTKYPKLYGHARKLMAVFGSRYLCEQLFLKMNLVKNKIRSSLTGGLLKSTLGVATSTI